MSNNDDFKGRPTTPPASESLQKVTRWLEESRRAKERSDLKRGLYADHWALQTLLNRAMNFARAYDLAVQTTLDARRPVHRDQQERICVHEDLISTYIGIDPVGYGHLIENASQYMQEEIDPSLECYHCLFALTAEYHLACDDLDKAAPAVQNYFSKSQEYDGVHHYAMAHIKMCELMYQHKDWAKLLYFAQQGEPMLLSMTANMDEYVSVILAAQTLALYKLRQENEANVTYRRTVAHARAVRGPLTHSYYNYLCDFKTASGDLQTAVNLRRRQLADMVDTGQLYWEAHIRLQLARLLKQTGESFQDEVERIRQLAFKLRKPKIITDQLATFLEE